MSYSQSYDNEGNGGGGGCMLLLLAAAAFALVMSLGGDDTSTSSANVEALSRNQVNLFSDVRNEYYDCIGAGSCLWFNTTTANTTTATSNTSTNVDGDRNVIYSSNGTRLCPNPDKPNEWGDVAAWCEAIGVQP